MSDVIHQPDQQRFIISLSTGEAVLAYEFLSNDSVDFFRTYVPDTERGKGYAEKLVKTGLAWAKSQKLAIEVSCSYVQAVYTNE